MLYRLKSKDRTVVSVDGTDHVLDPARDYDDANPADAVLVKRYRGWFRAFAQVEQATAAPGEKRGRRNG